MTNKYLKAQPGPKKSVIYFDEKGKKWIFEKGTRAWRNQNPGNMVVGKTSIENGMIGKAGGFAIFPDFLYQRKLFKNFDSTTYKIPICCIF